MLHLIKGRALGQSDDVEMIDGTAIQHLQPTQTYTYLEIAQRQSDNLNDVKTKLKQKYESIVKAVWSTELTAKNKCTATNMLSVPAVAYTFGAVRWNTDEIQELDRTTRSVMTERRSLHPRASIQRTYMSRASGGRGLINMEEHYRYKNSS
ncbi:hypothetical protein MML48_6g00013995 [Holotrichia oblita]|uniref:Uncharacterized protein n=1 Tax=Holotrichia oblita TaxID=644536 RepID=A0ACB9SYA3_HOLOL|nr:hypothetical protein MML48_6g00013995 [Holotrichia oblita]